MSTERTATVWSSTFVPSPSPLNGAGDGYAVAWVETADGRLQVLVDGTHAPTPGTRGRLVAIPDAGIDLFVQETP